MNAYPHLVELKLGRTTGSYDTHQRADRLPALLQCSCLLWSDASIKLAERIIFLRALLHRARTERIDRRIGIRTAWLTLVDVEL